MSKKLAYTYTVLRYVHDTSTAEFVNVGLVLHCAPRRYLGVKLRHTHRRLSAMFPDLDAGAFRASMTGIERALKTAGDAYRKDDLFSSDSDASQLARSILPSDDSSLQWSPTGSGLSDDPAAELDRLFNRLVAGYDERHERRRTDADVWRPIREKLDVAKLASKLGEKVIRGRDDSLEFKHAWKNGIWHCYEALSFDLADADCIKRKAREWMGHLTAVRDAPEKFKPYFIVGAPSNAKLLPAYRDAMAILKKSPVETEVFPETEADTLVALIETEVGAHN
jgi:Protein of unknown function (DUF3037)